MKLRICRDPPVATAWPIPMIRDSGAVLIGAESPWSSVFGGASHRLCGAPSWCVEADDASLRRLINEGAGEYGRAVDENHHLDRL